MLFVALVLSVSSCTQKQNSNVQIVNKPDEQKVDILFDGQLFTSYIYPSNVMKPVLWPIFTSKGTEVTRKFPLKKSDGERADHPHHVGMWLNYGDVNGYDFWNNSEAIPEDRKDQFGTIFQKDIVKTSTDKNEGTLVVTANWLAGGEHQLSEETTFHFINRGNIRIIDRTTKLTAEKDVNFNDNKEGVFGIRVTSELELPSDKEITLTDSHGNPTEIKAKNTKATGDYLSSEGITGADVWGTRGRWMKLYGHFGDEQVAVTIIDHPKNPGYPTYWHARGYGLFAANPLGQKQLSGGKDELNFSLKEGETATFRYRTVISSNDPMNEDEINVLADDFATLD